MKESKGKSKDGHPKDRQTLGKWLCCLARGNFRDRDAPLSQPRQTLGKWSAKPQKRAQSSLVSRSTILRPGPDYPKFFAQIVLPPFDFRKAIHMTMTPCKAPSKMFGLGEGAVSALLRFWPYWQSILRLSFFFRCNISQRSVTKVLSQLTSSPGSPSDFYTSGAAGRLPIAFITATDRPRPCPFSRRIMACDAAPVLPFWHLRKLMKKANIWRILGVGTERVWNSSATMKRRYKDK